jgi:hypothetical protein
MILIYHDEKDGLFEIVQSIYDSNFKLTMAVHQKVLPAGKYIIMLAPNWN